MLTTPAVVQAATPEPAPIPAISPYSLEALASRTYGEGELRIEYAWQDKEEFTRYYITYDSDGLNIHGYVNIPKGEGPFPVVIALHGYTFRPANMKPWITPRAMRIPSPGKAILCCIQTCVISRPPIPLDESEIIKPVIRPM